MTYDYKPLDPSVNRVRHLTDRKHTRRTAGLLEDGGQLRTMCLPAGQAGSEREGWGVLTVSVHPESRRAPAHVSAGLLPTLMCPC